jgi:hypothetical protein
MSDINPFEFVATDEALQDLRRRLRATRRPRNLDRLAESGGPT